MRATARIAGGRLLAIGVVTAALAVAVPGQATAAAGGWEVLTTPNPGTGHHILNDLSGTSDVDMWSVGSYEVRPHIPVRPLSLHWDGQRWRTLDVPVPEGRNNVELSAVDAVAPDDVWAVGSAGTTSDLQTETLVVHFDGDSWQRVPSPNVGGANAPNHLNEVTAVAPDDVWAVGYVHQDALSRPMVQHWDGRSWSVVPVPDPGAGHSVLSDVAAGGPDDVWAVGYAPSRTAGHEIEPYVLQWDGQSWTRMTTPNGGENGTWLTDVAISPAGEVFATGDWRWRTWAGSLTAKAAVMRYDGTSWSYVNVPSFDVEGTSVGDVTAGSDGDVWITGSSRTGEDFATLADGGDTWRLVQGAAPDVWAGPAHDGLTRVDGRVWMAGSYVPTSDNVNSRTYVERSPALS